MTQNTNKNLLAYIWIVLGILGRLLPHPANVSPMTALSLFGGAEMSRKSAFLLSFTTLVLSDMALAYLNGHAAFGYWSIFTYSGFAAIIFAGTFLKSNVTPVRTAGFLGGSSLFFWTWTNFGIWLTGDHGMYPRTLEGLAACYAAAVPFLGASLMGDMVWGAALFLSFYGARKLTTNTAAQGA